MTAQGLESLGLRGSYLSIIGRISRKTDIILEKLNLNCWQGENKCELDPDTVLEFGERIVKFSKEGYDVYSAMNCFLDYHSILNRRGVAGRSGSWQERMNSVRDYSLSLPPNSSGRFVNEVP